MDARSQVQSRFEKPFDQRLESVAVPISLVHRPYQTVLRMKDSNSHLWLVCNFLHARLTRHLQCC